MEKNEVMPLVGRHQDRIGGHHVKQNKPDSETQESHVVSLYVDSIYVYISTHV